LQEILATQINQIFGVLADLVDLLFVKDRRLTIV
jgi:hypothetical protein